MPYIFVSSPSYSPPYSSSAFTSSHRQQYLLFLLSAFPFPSFPVTGPEPPSTTLLSLTISTSAASSLHRRRHRPLTIQGHSSLYWVINLCGPPASILGDLNNDWYSFISSSSVGFEKPLPLSLSLSPSLSLCLLLSFFPRSQTSISLSLSHTHTYAHTHTDSLTSGPLNHALTILLLQPIIFPPARKLFHHF